MQQETTTPSRLASWSSRTAFLLAAVGAAVGLGNIWRFPYVAGENGGGAFVLVYAGFVLVLGVPIMMAELSIGRRGHRSPVITMQKLSRQEGRSRFWHLIGWLSILGPWLALTFYSVVAGWSLDYVFRGIIDLFRDHSTADPGSTFEGLLASPRRLLFWHTLFMAGTIFVIASGVQKGLERSVKLLMPALFAILIVLVGYAMVEGRFADGLSFMFTADFSKLTLPAVLMALGQAFFSLAVGAGALITYGAYLPETVSIPRASIIIAVADTMVAIVAGLAIFPIVFAYGLDPAEGPGLIFVTLPAAFETMPGGSIVGLLFFMLLTFAAFTSSIAMLEPPVSWLQDSGYNRPVMAVLAGGLAWVAGIAVALSFNIWSDVRLLPMVELLADKGIFDLIDFTVANLILPLTAMLIAIFTGWLMSRASTTEELGLGDGLAYRAWRVAVRYIAPVAIAFIFANSFL